MIFFPFIELSSKRLKREIITQFGLHNILNATWQNKRLKRQRTGTEKTVAMALVSDQTVNVSTRAEADNLSPLHITPASSLDFFFACPYRFCLFFWTKSNSPSFLCRSRGSNVAHSVFLTSSGVAEPFEPLLYFPCFSFLVDFFFARVRTLRMAHFRPGAVDFLENERKGPFPLVLIGLKWAAISTFPLSQTPSLVFH